MKYIITSLILLLMVLSVDAQNERMQAALGQAMAKYAECKVGADFEELSLKFKRIADAETKEWLPRYYQAHSMIIGNFSSQADAATRDLKLDEAQDAIDKMKELVPNESEVAVIQALLYTARLVVDPQNRGQEYGAKSAIEVGKALGMNPNNARAQYMQIANEQGTAQFFGKDLQEYCDRASALVDKWDELDKPLSPLHPSWGKDQTQGIANACDQK